MAYDYSVKQFKNLLKEVNLKCTVCNGSSNACKNLLNTKHEIQINAEKLYVYEKVLKSAHMRNSQHKH